MANFVVTFLLLAWSALAAAAEGSAIFLIAKPEMPDPNFKQTVVLVVNPPNGAPVGVVLNRPTDLRLGKVLDKHPRGTAREDPVYAGGPVERNTLWFVFRAATAPPRAWHVVEDVYFSGQASALEWVFRQPQGAEQKFFAGYAGWSPGQLENEIARGDWLYLRADPANIFRLDVLQLWPELLRRARQVQT